MRMTLLVALVVPIAVAFPWATCTGQDRTAATLKQDRLKLKGDWCTEDWRRPNAKGWQCHIQVGVGKDADNPRFSLTINLELDGKATTGTVLGAGVEQKEKGDKRWMSWDDPESAKKQKLPAYIYYRFDGDALVLTLPDGEYKGEYKLKKVKGK